MAEALNRTQKLFPEELLFEAVNKGIGKRKSFLACQRLTTSVV